MAKHLQAKVWTMTRVTSIDTAQQCIKLGEDEAVLHYRKLVLALGADTITPPLEGDARDYVYSINDLMDYADFRQAIARNDVKKVCIIGAGLIGCEFTNDLLNGGFAVEAVDPLTWCLPTLLPEPAGRGVQRALEEHEQASVRTQISRDLVEICVVAASEPAVERWPHGAGDRRARREPGEAGERDFGHEAQQDAAGSRHGRT